MYKRQVFDVVDNSIKSLLNPELTASWEKGLTYVADGDITPDEYMRKLDHFIVSRTNGVKGLNNQYQLRGCLLYTSVTILNLFLSAVVFLIFWFMVFYKLTVKHTDRIQKYEEELQFFLKFFDIKSFCIMAFMMIFGISIRSFNLAPDVFIAVFYTGLGTALFLSLIHI